LQANPAGAANFSTDPADEIMIFSENRLPLFRIML